jgi:hypothetical protein
MSGQDAIISGNVAESLDWIPRIPFHQPAWLFIFLFILLGSLAWIRIYYGNILTQTLQASANFQIAARMFNDNSLLQRQLDNILYFLYFLSAGFLAYVVENRFQLFPYGITGIILYFFNLAVLGGLFFLRVVLVNLAGLLFNRIRIFREYLYNAFIFNKLLGVIMLPLLLFVFYTTGPVKEIFHWFTFGIVFVILIMRMIRGVIFSIKKDVSIFYMFLYLCALEIVPLALLYKWVEGIL